MVSFISVTHGLVYQCCMFCNAFFTAESDESDDGISGHDAFDDDDLPAVDP